MAKMHHNKGVDMTSGPIMRQVTLFALPICLGSILQLLYSTVDAIVIGNFCGASSLAAVGTSSQPVEVVMCLFLGIGSRREDGYHDATTIMHALAMHDKLTISLVESGEHVMVVEPNDAVQPNRQEEVKVWVAGITMQRTPSAIFFPFRIAPAMRRSEMRPLVQEPITT